MAVYLQATLELDYETLPIFMGIVPNMKRTAESAGWEMIAGLVTKIGRANTIVHLWKLPNMDAFDAGIKAMAEAADGAHIYQEICRSGAKETLTFLDAAPYCPPL